MFQHPSLLPWRTIAGNVRYGMEMQKRFDEATMQQRAGHFLKLVGLSGFEKHYPGELSGGMQQRVNLARALASDPVVLLMDEPFAALDAQTREFMQSELLKIWTKARKTVLFITHQINEAVYLADRVAVMSARPGRVKAVFDIPFGRPRTWRSSAIRRFLEIEDPIWQPDRGGSGPHGHARRRADRRHDASTAASAPSAVVLPALRADHSRRQLDSADPRRLGSGVDRQS